MNRWSALAALAAITIALALRVPNLDLRPLHNDEAVNAIKVADLWEGRGYKYDPEEHHGPTLHYATLPFLSLSGAKNSDELKDAPLRWSALAFGVGLLFLLPFFADGLGKTAMAWAAIFIAVSPAMVFYSRYFIHEMLLVFFTAATLGAGWRYAQTRRAAWALTTGAGVGLMFATKETFVLSVAAMGAAGVATAWWMAPESYPRHRPLGGPSPPPSPKGRGRSDRLDETQSLFKESIAGATGPLSLWERVRVRAPAGRDAALAISACLFVWLVFFSSFFTNFGGLLDSVRTYFPWLKRAGGESPHIHPWYFYLQRLAWFHPVKGPVWSEGFILALAVFGTVSALRGRKSGLACFLAFYTWALTAVYALISYKTPWCLLNFYFGMLLLAGLGAVAVSEFFNHHWMKIFVWVALAGLTTQLGGQSWRANNLYASDRRNPYVYAQTLPDLLNLVQKAEGVARSAPDGFNTILKVIGKDGDYWPLPWYLRRFKQAGWYEKLPDDPFAPIVIVSAKLDARLDERSDKKWVMVGYTELRPQKFLEMYVELELWKKYVATLPPARE